MTLRASLAALGLGLVGCGPGATTPYLTTPTADTSTKTDPCTYPEASEPMALGEVLFPYRWLDARHRDGRTGEIRLRNVFCDNDEDIDWSPFDALLFVSIPAW